MSLSAADSSRPTLLGIFAHPDDESFGPGGTLAKYAREGVDVHICIATDGAAGSADEALLAGYDSLAQRRAEELRQAVATLGGTLHLLNFGDSGMDGSEHNQNPHCLVQAPLDEVACRIVALMREVRPQVVITHDPTGGYFHPDHIKVNQAVSRAWALADTAEGCPAVALPPWQPTRLFWTALPRTWLRRMVRLLRLARQDPTRFGRNRDIDLTRLGTPDEQLHSRIDVAPFLPIKQAASAHHASQGGGMQSRLPLPAFAQRRLFGSEHYTQARPATPRYASDLFEGLR